MSPSKQEPILCQKKALSQLHCRDSRRTNRRKKWVGAVRARSRAASVSERRHSRPGSTPSRAESDCHKLLTHGALPMIRLGDGKDPMAAERLLSTKKFDVERRALTDPSGRTVLREVVVHPGAVVILPVLDRDRLVMIRNFRYSVEEELWELPAGTAEPGEPAVETARRELIEETGYRGERMTPLAEFYTSPGVMTELMRAFVAEGLTPVGQRLEPDERIKVEIVTFTRAKEMLTRGELRDGKTIAVLGMYLARNAG